MHKIFWTTTLKLKHAIYFSKLETYISKIRAHKYQGTSLLIQFYVVCGDPYQVLFEVTGSGSQQAPVTGIDNLVPSC